MIDMQMVNIFRFVTSFSCKDFHENTNNKLNLFSVRVEIALFYFPSIFDTISYMQNIKKIYHSRRRN